VAGVSAVKSGRRSETVGDHVVGSDCRDDYPVKRPPVADFQASRSAFGGIAAVLTSR
jgi:hypothetical protein